MGMVTNIAIATAGAGLPNQVAAESHNEDLKLIGGMAVDSLLVMDFKQENTTALKVDAYFNHL